MIDLGIVRPGATIRIPFSTFDKDDGSSITMTNFAVGDILVYKDGSTTERASTSGYTATTDFDAKTGKHLAIIDLADNTTADFFQAGSEYLVAIDAVTVDAVTTGGWIARFRIGYRDAVLDTTIATLTNQTSFTLTSGPAEDDALNGMWAIIHDAASAVQFSVVQISDYTGSTKTVTLAAGATFTVAAKDNISVMGPVPLQPTVTGRTLDVSSGGEAGVDWANVGSPTTSVSLTNTVVGTVTTLTNLPAITSNWLTAAGLATDAVQEIRDAITGGAYALSTDANGRVRVVDGTGAGELDSASGRVAITEAQIDQIVDEVWDEDATGHQTQGTFGQAIGDPAADADTLYALVTSIESRLPAALVSGRMDSSVGAMAANVVTESAIADGAINRASLAADTGLQTVRSNTAQAGASATITLDASASATDDIYNDNVVYITGGTGAGQIRRITDYVGATKVATVKPNWTTAPDNTSTFAVLPATSAWDEVLADHLDSGSTGAALNAAGSAGDPWSTSLPGAYGAGSAGFILGTYLNATVSSRSSHSAADVWASGSRTLTALGFTLGASDLAAGILTSAKFAAGAIDAAATSADFVTEIRNAITGGAYALSTDATGAVRVVDGTGTGEIGLTAGAIDSVLALGASALASVNAEMVDCLNVDTYAEPSQGAPAATATIAAKLGWLFAAWRNKKTQTASEQKLFADDTTTVLAKASASDDGTTLTIGEFATGP